MQRDRFKVNKFLLFILMPFALFAVVPVFSATYHFDKVAVAETVCTATTTTTITTTTLSGTQITIQNNLAGAGDYHLRMDATGVNPTYAQMMYTPQFGSCAQIAANATFALYCRVTYTGTTPQWQIILYDMDPSVACATGTLIGQSAWTNNAGGSATYATTNLTIANPVYAVPAGHRIRFEVWLRGYAGTTNCRIRYGAAGTDSYLTTTESACNGTTTGSVTANPSGCNAISVSAPYTGDANGNNTLSYRYRTPSGTGIWSSTTNLPHSASPYNFTIPGLTFGVAYDVEVTYNDADGITGTNPQTVTNILVGGNCTVADVVSASEVAGATPSIGVSAPYSFDNNANNTLSYRYRTPSGTGAWSAPVNLPHSASPYSFTISGLICGNSYDVEVTYNDADGIGSGSQVQTISNIILTNCTTTQAPTANIDSCSQITVSAPFLFDANNDGFTDYYSGPTATGPWTGECAAVAGASPRLCVISGLSGSTTYYLRVSFTDPDAISGSNPQVIGPYTTPSCVTNQLVVGTNSAVVDSCTQITASAAFTGDNNNDSTTKFEYGPAATGPWTVQCNGVSGASPRTCIISGLTQNSTYYIRITHTDPDGVSGTNPEVIGPFTTQDCRTTISSNTAVVNSCNQITISGIFTGNFNNNGSTQFERGPAAAGPWSNVCASVSGSSPRTCVDNGVTELNTYYYRVTYTDSDGVVGTNPEIIGPYSTLSCVSNNLTIVTNSASVFGCAQINANATFTGDGNNNSSTNFDYSISPTGPWTQGCPGVTGASPRNCSITGLTAGTPYYVRVLHSDIDGVSGINPEVIGPFTTTTICMVPGVATAVTASCSSINASAPFTQDTNNNSSTAFDYSTSQTGPWTNVCASVIGVSPRICNIPGLTQNTIYYIRVTHSDPDGITGNAVQVIPVGPTPDCRTNITGSSGEVNACNQITITSTFSGDFNASSATTFDRGPTGTGPWTNSCSINTASPRQCVDSGVTANNTYYYRVTYTDTDGVIGTNPEVIGPFYTPECAPAGTTLIANSAAVNSCNEIRSQNLISGDGDNDGSTLFESGPAAGGPWTVGCATVTGQGARSCFFTALTASSTYYIRITMSDPDGISGANPQVIGPYNTPACGADTAAPTIQILTPAADSIMGGSDKIQAQVWDKVGISTVTITVDSGAVVNNAAMTGNALYNCGTGCGVYEYTLNTTLIGNGSHTMTISSTDTSSNPASASIGFKVFNAGSTAGGEGTILRRTNSNMMCMDCHTLPTHSSQQTGNKYGNWAMNCRDCHIPHSTRNIYLIRESLKTPNSGTKTIVFQTDDRAGNTNPNLSYLGDKSGAGNTPYDDGVCEACHTKTSHYRNDTSGGDHTHNVALRCVGCHTHETGFKPGGESNGNQPCDTCHSDLYNAMSTNGTNYHHYLNNANATYGTAPPASGVDTTRNCLMCHADHNIFRPDLNPSSVGRAGNLRQTINVAPTTTTDFVKTDFVNDSVKPGVCLTCHITSMTRANGFAGATAVIPYNAGTTAEKVSAFNLSAHQFTVNSTFATDSSTFQADCSKCHNDTLNPKSGMNGQNGSTYSFGNHDSTIKQIKAPLGIVAPGTVLEENFCYQCHSGGAAGNDYYGVKAMSASAKSIQPLFAYTFKHDVAATIGVHSPTEGTSSGWLPAGSRHIQCEDCHNPHAASPIADINARGTVSSYTTNAAPTHDVLTDNSKAWTANQWKGYTVKVITSTGAGQMSTIYGNTVNTLSVEFATAPSNTSTYMIDNTGRSDGNLVSGAQAKVWGVAPTFPAQPAPPNWNDSAGAAAPTEITTQYNAIAAWNRTESATIQGQICIKCHSSYAYGNTPPNTPSGLPTSTSTTWSNTVGGAIAQGNKANEFNPNNLSYHPVFSKGANQPITATGDTAGTASYYNTNWPKFTTGTVSITTGGAATFSSAIPTVVIPGWYIYAGNIAPGQGLTTGWYQILTVTSNTQVTVTPNPTTAKTNVVFMLTAGLGNNFVPPWGPWSTMKCSDCHESSTTTDPLGPHGSATKWLLKMAPAQTFAWYNGTNVVQVTLTPTDTNNICVNCHRRDVYGDYNYTAPTYNLYPRQEHPIDKGQNHSLTTKTKWGFVCTNCHGGARIGAIHGLNLGRGNNGGGGSYSGRMLLAGAAWYAVTRSSTTTNGACWTKGATDSVDNCSRAHGGTTFLSGASAGKSTYDYQNVFP